MDDLGAGDIGDGLSVGRPNDAANAHVVVGNRGLGSIGEPADDEVAAFSRGLIFGAMASDERDTLAVRGRGESGAGIGLAPREFSFASCGRNFPQIAFVHKINAFAILAPEGVGDSTCRKRSERDGRATAVRAPATQLSDVRT